VDHAKLLPLCRAIQEYYKSINANTQVLGASLTSTEEIYSLAGIDRLTISPPLLEQLSTQAAPVNAPSLFDAAPTTPLPAPGTSYLNDSGKFQITFTRDLNGASNVKLIEV
jgi:transaldolase